MKKAFCSLLFLCVITGLALLAPKLAAAQAPTPQGSGQITDDQVNAVARQLYCPVCENIPLDVCPTQACAQWRELIREKLGQGWSDQQIKDYFVAQYGDRVVGTPPARGLNWLAYIIPPVAIVLGIFILYRAFKAWKTSAPTASTAELPTTQDDEYVRRLEDELRKN